MTARTLRSVGVAALVASIGVATAATNWSAQDYDLYSGDFNGDGNTDVLYIAKKASGSSGIATSGGNGLSTIWQSWSSNYLGIQWYDGAYVALIGDFNNDKRSDVLLQRTTAGDSYLLLTDAQGRLTGISQTISQTQLGLAWSKDQHSIMPGEFSGDGRSDLFFQAAMPSGVHGAPLSNTNGLFTLNPAQTFTNASWPAFKWSRNFSVISVGDFNGDGRDDLLVQAKPAVVLIDFDIPIPVPIYAPNFFGVVYSQGGATPLQPIGVQQWSRVYNGVDWSPVNAVPVIGDFNGDGRDDVLLQSRSTGQTSYLLTGNAAGAAFSAPVAVSTSVTLAANSAKLLAGHFGGSGSAAGVYIQANTASGTNFIASTLNAASAAIEHNPAAMVGPAEVVTYSYDARGRVKSVARVGGVNDGVQTQYTYDKANNRKTVITTGSTNPTP